MKTRKRPAPPQNGPSRNDTDGKYFTAPWRHDRHEPLTPEDRADIDLLISAAERGFRLAVRCTRCGSWLVAMSSVRAHMGPVCRAKVVGD